MKSLEPTINKKIYWLCGFVWYCLAAYLTQMPNPWDGFALAFIIIFCPLLAISYIAWFEES